MKGFHLYLTAAFIMLMVLAVTMPTASARPVSYAGGWTMMSMNSGSAHTMHLHYSPTAFTSWGYKAEYWRGEDHQIHALQMNNLLKRWNNPDSQGNLYLKSGAGVALSDYGDFENKTEPALFTGLAADWEDRRYFVSYENRVTEAGDIRRDFQQSGRVGIAPYIGDYGDLHTWLMLEVEHTPESEDNVTVTPMVRLFKGNTLVETGLSNHGDVMFNLVYRY